MRALRVELRASRILTMMLALVFGGGAASLLVAFPGVAGALLAATLLAVGWAAARRRAWLRAPASVRAIEVLAGDEAILELRSGRRVKARIAGRRYVTGTWISLPLKDAPGRTLLVLRDMVDPAAFRRLRLWALWGRWPQGLRPSATS